METPLVSVVIATKNEEKVIKDLLSSIKNQSYKNIEIILVDNKSTDKTERIAKKFTTKVFNKGPERSTQRNYGVSQADGEYILLLDADMKLSKDVVKNCIKEIKANKKLKALIIPEESFGEGFWAKCKKLERSFYLGVDFIEAPRFFEKKSFEEIKGYNTDIAGGEDYDLRNRFKEKYGEESVGRIKSFIFHNEGRLSLIKTCKKKFYYSRFIDLYNKRQKDNKQVAKPSSIPKMYKLFFSHPIKLIRNPIIAGGMLFMKTSEYGAGAIGYVYSKFKKNNNG